MSRVSSFRTFLFFCAIVAYLTFFYQLGNLPFLGADEPRYARIGEEMLVSGDLITPTLGHQPWLEKPPLLYWLEAASYAVFGVAEWSARLPVAILALLSAGVVAGVAAHLRGRRAGILTFLILCTSGLYFVYARAASTDMPLTATLSVSLLLAYLSTRYSSFIWTTGAAFFLALAVLAKGPVALVLFLGIVGAYLLIQQNFPYRWFQIVSALLVFLAAAAPWFWLVWKANGFAFIATFWINHHLARFVTPIHHHVQPFWYYLPVLLVGAFPWVFFIGSSMRRLWRLRRRIHDGQTAILIFLWLWVLVPLGFFSLSSSKLAGYILPVLPALALLSGLEWDRYIGGDVISHRLMRIELSLLAAFSIVIVVVLIVGFQLTYDSVTTGLLIALPVLAAVGVARHEYRRRRPLSLFLSLVAGMTLMTALAYWKAAPVLGAHHSTRSVVTVANPLISQEEPLVLFRYFHHSARYYSDFRTTAEAVSGYQELEKYMGNNPQERYLILTQEPGWEELRQRYPSLELVAHQGNLYLVEIPAPPAPPEQ